MSKYKILFGITGSIAAYKSAYLISKLLQNDFEVKVIATENSLKFIGKATLEGLTGHSVYTDSFAEGEMMNHINLVKWADLTIVCPASANTINKMANGIADNLLTSLFLAHDLTKPFLIAPAMNTLMYQHPATQSSLKKLEEWGVKILPTAEGYLACGDIGKGKLLEPDEIFKYILDSIPKKVTPVRRLKVLVTAGGTKESIDGVRFITNLSTGRTGVVIANYFSRNGHAVTCLLAKHVTITPSGCDKILFESFNDLNQKLECVLSENDFDCVIHLAAVSDYSLETIELNGKKLLALVDKKIDSENERLVLNLKRNFKIADRLKSYSKNKNILLIVFKFTNTFDGEERNRAVKKLMNSSNSDYVVSNDQSNRTSDDVQNNFTIFDKDMKSFPAVNAEELSRNLEHLLLETIGGK
ncbi:MAG: bifunctional phosphopantothenoylcysteine decarboxylase/phosphopantothenate--cysteine ligase CoaBC [Melioribacteraceae bacterium]